MKKREKGVHLGLFLYLAMTVNETEDEEDLLTFLSSLFYILKITSIELSFLTLAIVAVMKTAMLHDL